MSDLLYYIEVSDPFGTKLAQLDQYLRIVYARVVNDIGVLTLDLDPDTNRDLFRLDGRLGVWRQPADGPLALETETVFLVRRVRRVLTERGERRLQVTALSAAELLARRIVAYAAGSAEASKTAEVDDMMKAIVRENLGASATDADRDWSALLSVAADETLGPSLSKAFSRRNVLMVLQELAEAAAMQGQPVYFDIVSPTAGGLEFRTYIGQRGQNRTGADPLILSPELGTISDAEYEEDYAEEVTAVYAAGQGEGDEREVSEASDATRIGASPFGRREALRDARHGATGASLGAEAEAALRMGRPRRLFAATIADTPQCKYGVHWRWGDLLKVQFEQQQFNCRVDVLQVTVADGAETISAKLRAEETL